MRCGKIREHLFLNVLFVVSLVYGCGALAHAQTDPSSILQTGQRNESPYDQTSRSGTGTSPLSTPVGVNQQSILNERSLDNSLPPDKTSVLREVGDASATRTLNQLPPDQPTEFQRLVQSSVGQLLPIYGAKLFANSPSTFAPLDGVPVTPDYVVGPGDELRIQVWGQVTLNSRFTVDRDGNIFIPQVGSLRVAGLPFAQLQDQLKSQMSRVFRNFDLSVNMGHLRSMQIFVLGQARRPGNYTISSLSTLVDALFATGGPSPQGSLRHVQLKRSGKVVVDFDLYDLIQRGDKSNDVQLLPGDIIYIPSVGPQVAVAGSVNVPAIYELKSASGSSLDDTLATASGTTNIASNVSVRLERIDAHKMRSVSQLPLDQAGRSTELRDGDIVEVDAVTNQYRDGLTLRGNVANPGHYGWKPGMRLRDLLPNKDALITRGYWLSRGQLGEPTLTYIPYCAASARDIVPGRDCTYADQRTPANEQPIAGGTTRTSGTEASGTGGATRSAAEAFVDKANTGFDARNTVTLSAPDIDWSYAVIERQGKVDLSTTLLPFNLGRLVLNGDDSQNLELQPGDVITIFSKADIRVPQAEQTRFIRLEGEFVSAGVYSALPGETLQQLIKRAGGLTKDAYLYGSQFTRESTRRLQQQRLNEYIDQVSLQASTNAAAASTRNLSSLDAASAAATQAQNLSIITTLRQARSSGRIVLNIDPYQKDLAQLAPVTIEDGDTFIVPSVPSIVSVSGSVYNPNSFLARPDTKLATYLSLAGGPNRLADARHAYVIRADGSVVGREQISSLHRGSFGSLRMYPGDTIVVPLKIDRGTTLRNVVDFAQIVGQFGLAIAAANVVF